MWFKVQPQLTLQGDPECGLYLRACPTSSKGTERSPAKGVLGSATCAASLVLGLGWGRPEDVAHCVTPRHSRPAAPLTQKPLPKKVRGRSHQQQLHPQQPVEGPKGTRGTYRTPAESATSQPRAGAGLPRISSADCVPALRKHMLVPERQTNQVITSRS